MPVTLNQPVEPPMLLKAKVVNFTVENNIEHWIVVYVSWGQILDGVFVEWVDPNTGVAAVPLKVKIEDGFHPLAEGTALRKCVDCGKWWQLEAECDCGAATVQYDGFSRLAMTPPDGDIAHDVLANWLYNFLTTEQVPDPVTWEPRLILDATQ